LGATLAALLIAHPAGNVERPREVGFEKAIVCDLAFDVALVVIDLAEIRYTAPAAGPPAAGAGRSLIAFVVELIGATPTKPSQGRKAYSTYAAYGKKSGSTKLR
jgi:hypothetical protein